jgi:hypothetical protein
MKTGIYAGLLSAAIVSAVALHAPTSRAANAELDCKLHFNLTGWSAIYKHAEGSGTVTCANGTAMPVLIQAKGVGLTVGKSKIDDGTGKFSDVHTITDVLGDYVQGEAHAGVVKSGTAQLLTKGPVSLALAGSGEGVDLGIDVGKFTISQPKR